MLVFLSSERNVGSQYVCMGQPGGSEVTRAGVP